MKRYFWIGVIILSLLTLISCATHTYPYLNSDLTQETWMRAVDSDVNRWKIGSDQWFLTGDPNPTEMASRRASYDAAISTMNVRVPNFTKITVNGDFQVQIFGTYERNSVYVYGPNEDVRNAMVQIVGDTLVVSQVRPSPGMHNVIIRIGVNQLTELAQLGCGTIEGIRLHSSGLSIVSSNKGNIYLSGDINLLSVVNTNAGSVNVFGVRSPCLDIRTSGSGCVNVCGNVGIRSIVHFGSGDINIVGANSGGLTILAEGFGKIGINGTVNLFDLKATGKTGVFVTNVSSGKLSVLVKDQAVVGLAGRVGTLNVDAFDSSIFFGRSLCTDNAYVRAHKNAHINIAAGNKIFASASESSSIYIFGTPNMVSQFVTGNATIVPLAAGARSSCAGVVPAAQAPVLKPVQGVKVYGYSRPKWKLKHIDTNRRNGEG